MSIVSGFERICRTCMSESPVLLSIFDKQAGASDESTICGMLRLFTTIDASPTDGLPQRVCITCLSEINRSVSFKQKCERSENTLQSCLPQSMKLACDVIENIKADPNDEQTISEPAQKRRKLSEKCEDETDSKDENAQSLETSSVTHDNEIALKLADFDKENGNQHNVDDVENVHWEIQEEDAHTENVEEHEHDQPQLDDDEYMEEEVLSVHSSHAGAEESSGHQLSDHDEPEPNVDDHNNTTPEYQIDDGNDLQFIASPSAATTVPVKCSKCDACFQSERSLRMHQQINKCTMPTFECPDCRRVFVYRKNLRAHRQQEHSAAARKLTCSLCAKRFETAAALAAHRSERHSAGGDGDGKKRRQFECAHCQRSFGMLSTLRDHMRTHSGEKPFLCGICGKGFAQRANMSQHMLRHTQTRKFQCEHCPKAFVSKGELGTHMHTHTGAQPFKCGDCGVCFSTGSSLVKHRRIHTGERPYACEHCPMRFAALATLKNHRRTHTGERPFKCDQCERTFAQRSDCVTHQKLHGAPRLQCKFCNRSYTRINALKAHEKKHRDKDNIEELEPENEDRIDVNDADKPE